MTDRPVVYTITCATLAAADIGKLVDLIHARGWDTCVLVTPKALAFIDKEALETQTGYPVRSEYKRPGSPDILPKATAVIVAEASFNTMNKWALGITDNLDLGIIAEAPGLGLPVVLLPFVNAALAEHPAYNQSLEVLRRSRVTVLSGPDVYQPHPAGTGPERLKTYPLGVGGGGSGAGYGAQLKTPAPSECGSAWRATTTPAPLPGTAQSWSPRLTRRSASTGPPSLQSHSELCACRRLPDTRADAARALDRLRQEMAA